MCVDFEYVVVVVVYDLLCDVFEVVVCCEFE